MFNIKNNVTGKYAAVKDGWVTWVDEAQQLTEKEVKYVRFAVSERIFKVIAC